MIMMLYHFTLPRTRIELFLRGLLFFVYIFFLPIVVLGANEVSITENTTFVLPSDSSQYIILSGSKFDSLTINNDNFEFVMSGGGKATLESSAGTIFTTSDINKSTVCTGSQSSIIVELDPGDSDGKTIAITPSSNTCISTGASSGGSTSGGGGGGGGFTTTTLPPALTLPPAEEPPPSLPASSVPSTSVVFGSNLGLGMQNSDVTRLQILLAGDKSIYPEGLITGYFGLLTQKAIERFQIKYSIVSSGSPGITGFGYVGPKTRAKIQEVFGGIVKQGTGIPQAPAVMSSLFTSGLGKGISSADVKRLQQLLNSDPDTRIADSGVGSIGNETNFFGSLTEKAVEKFQIKYAIASAGDPGFGYVGPKTRAKLQEVFGQSQIPVIPSPSPAPASAADTAELQAQINAAQAQLNVLLEQLQNLSQ